MSVFVDKNTKVVEYAVVFLKFATAPKYNFADTGLPAQVVIDQPFCAFKPHVSVVDVKDQKLIVKDPEGRQTLEMPGNSVMYLTANYEAKALTQHEVERDDQRR